MWNFFPPQLRADGRSPKMIEHLGQERCKKTSEKLERQRANKFEVKMAESAHDKAFGDVSSMFAVIDLNMLQYSLSIITSILLDLSWNAILPGQASPRVTMVQTCSLNILMQVICALRRHRHLAIYLTTQLHFPLPRISNASVLKVTAYVD